MENAYEHRMESRTEHAHSRNELTALINGKLQDGAFDVAGTSHRDALIVEDGQGHYSERAITPEEAEAIERWAWTADELTTRDAVSSRIVKELEKKEFRLHSSDTFDLTVRLKKVALR